MAESEVLARTLSDVQRLHDNFYSNEGDAFSHFIVQEYFDASEDEALEWCDVGGKGDKGIDAFWHDEQERRFVLVQTKWSKNSRTRFGAEVITKAATAYKWLERIQQGKRGGAASRVVECAAQLQDLRRIDASYPVVFYCVVFGNFTAGAQHEIRRVEAELEQYNVQLITLDRSAITSALEERWTESSAPALGSLTLRIRQSFLYTGGKGAPRAMVATIPGRDLARAAQIHKSQLFEANVRYFLKKHTRHNKGIAKTLEEKEGRRFFWYYNNGIAIVCDKFTVAQDGASVEIDNMQIVNGAQTTSTLAASWERLADNDVDVLVRIVESSDLELRQKIALYNNQQNAVNDRDLLSNDSQQERLQQEFLSLPEPWFYERKRGDWTAKIELDGRLKKRVAGRRIDNIKAAQAAYAFYFDPARARADKKRLFVRKFDLGYYEDIFNEDTSPEWLLLPFMYAQHIAVEKAKYLRQLRNVDEKSPTKEDRALLSREWIKFSDQFFLGTFGYYVRRCGEFDEERLSRLKDAAQEHAPVLYNMAKRDLGLFFAARKRDANNRGEEFSTANYVKGNWDAVVESLDHEWDYRIETGEGDALMRDLS